MNGPLSPWHPLRKLILILLAAPAVILPGSAPAVIIGSYVENADGTFTYSYEVDNSAGTFDVVAWSLTTNLPIFDGWSDVASGGSVSVPDANWIAQPGTPSPGGPAPLDFISLDPAGDVLVGTMLDGFSFTTPFAPGAVTYFEFSALGDFASGVTIGPVPDLGGGAELVGVAALALLAWLGRGHRERA